MNSNSEQFAAPPEAVSGLWRRSLGWILAATLALVWHVFWGCWLGPAEPVFKAGLSESPMASFLPAPPTKSGDDSSVADSVALWSPAVFSLPSSIGFSRAALTNGTAARPPLQVPGGALVFLDRPVRAKPELGFRFGSDLDESVRDVLTNLPERLQESPVFGSAKTTGTAIQVELSARLKEEHLRRMDIPVNDILLKDKPWEVVALIEFDAEGKVTGVFLETKSGFEDVDASLNHALWRWLIENAKAPLSGRVTFRSPGRPPTASEPQSAGNL